MISSPDLVLEVPNEISFYAFSNFSENLQRSTEVFGNPRKFCGRDRTVRKRSQRLESIGAGFEKSSK